MKQKLVCFLLALCLTLSALPMNITSVSAAGKSGSDEAFKFVENLGLGWNLGNSLDSITGQKTHSVSSTETSWGNIPTTKQMIKIVADAGFKTVRVPVTYYDNSDNDANIDDEWLDRVEEVVNYVLDCGMYCIIDVHHDTGMGAWIMADGANYEKSSYRLERLWQQIAERFKDYDNRLIFEGFNELLNSKNDWDNAGSESYEITNKLNQLFVDTVRASGGNNSSRYLLTNLYAAIPSAANIEGFELPEDTVDNRIIVGFHSYSADNADIENIFSRIRTNFIDKGIPAIMGEYGMVNHTVNDNTNARKRYISKVVSEAKKSGIPCLWWDNGGDFSSAGDVNNYALLDRNRLSWYFPELVEMMFSALEGNLYTEPDKPNEPDNNPVSDTGITRIESLSFLSGDQKIETDIKLGLDSEYELTFSAKNSHKYGNFILVANSNRVCYRVRQEISLLYIAYGYNNFPTTRLEANEKHVISQKGNKTYIDGVLARSCTVQDFEPGTLTIGDAQMNFYGMTIAENGKVIHNLVPVLDKSGKACVYDKVTEKFYYAKSDIGYVKGDPSSFEDDEKSPTDIIGGTIPTTPTTPTTAPTIMSSVNSSVTTASTTAATTTTSNTTQTISNNGFTSVDSVLLSSGNKKIETDIKLGLESEYEVKFSTKSDNAYGNFMLVENDKRVCYRVRQEIGDLYVAYGYNNFPTVKLKENRKYIVSQKGNNTYIDGKLVSGNAVQDFEPGTLTIGDAQMNFYGMTVTEKGKVVHDLVPVLDKSGKACIYDKVTGKSYYAKSDIEYVRGSSSGTGNDGKSTTNIIIGTTAAIPTKPTVNSSINSSVTTAATTVASTLQTTSKTTQTISKNDFTKVASVLLSYGNRKIETDIKLNLESEYEVTFSPNSDKRYGNFILVANDKRVCYRVRQELGDLYVAYGYNNFPTVKLKENQKYVVSQKGNRIYIDGSFARSCTLQDFEPGTLTIGDAQMNFYGMTITENGKVVHDLIPVLDKSGKACVIDVKTGKFYYAKCELKYVA